METEKEITSIRARNKRVDADKAWETSLTRRIFIGVFTYIIASMWMISIDVSQPFLSAAVPTGGYLLSTWSLPFLKRFWLKKKS